MERSGIAVRWSALLCFLVFPEAVQNIGESLGTIFLKTGFVHKNKVIPDLRLRLIDVFIPLPQSYHFQVNILVLLTPYFHNHDTAIG